MKHADSEFNNNAFGSEDGLLRSRELERRLSLIASEAAKCEFESLGKLTKSECDKLLHECINDEYVSENINSFFPYLYITAEDIYGDLPHVVFKSYYTQVLPDLIDFFLYSFYADFMRMLQCAYNML